MILKKLKSSLAAKLLSKNSFSVNSVFTTHLDIIILKIQTIIIAELYKSVRVLISTVPFKQ